MSEERSAIYAIRWEILVMGATLAIVLLVVLAIPNDFTTKMLEEQKEEREAEESAELATVPEEAERAAAESGLEEMIPNSSGSKSP